MSRASDVDPAVAAVGARIAAARKAAGLTQEDVAAATGILAPEVSKIENGRQDPRLSTVLRIAGALGVEAGSLLP